MYTRVFYFCLLLIFSSCGKDSDEEIPVISNFTVNGQSDSIVIDAGSEITIEGTLADNESLSQCRIEIHPASEGHSHLENDSITTYPYSFGNWSFVNVEILEGLTDGFSFITIVPDSVKGEFHFLVNAIDTNGNEMDEFYTPCQVSNENLPAINFLTLNDNVLDDEETAIILGSQLTMEGEISDPDGLQEIELGVFTSSGDTLSMENFTFTQNSVLLEDIMQSIVFDNSLANRFRISVVDMLGWKNEYIVYIDVQ